MRAIVSADRKYVLFPPTGLNGESAASKGRKKTGGPSPSGSEPLREKIVGEEGGGTGLKGAP